MTERQPESLQIISSVLHPITHEYRFMEIQRRKAELEVGWFVKSAGRLVTNGARQIVDKLVQEDETYITGKKLKGVERTLNKGTLIHARSFALPRDTSEAGIDAFLNDNLRTPGLYRKIGWISINEPGTAIFKPINTEEDGYFESYASGVMLASEGIYDHLNTQDGIYTQNKSNNLTNEIIKQSYARVPVHIDRVFNAVFFPPESNTQL